MEASARRIFFFEMLRREWDVDSKAGYVAGFFLPHRELVRLPHWICVRSQVPLVRCDALKIMLPDEFLLKVWRPL